MNKLLRDATRIAEFAGFEYVGVRGSGHYAFANGSTTIIMASSPTNRDNTLKNFRKDVLRTSQRAAHGAHR